MLFRKGPPRSEKANSQPNSLSQREPLDRHAAEAHCASAAAYWDEAHRNARLNETQRRDCIQKGLASADQAIRLAPERIDAIVYRGLFLRLRATLETDSKRQQELIKEASALQEKAAAIRKRATGKAD